MPVLEQVLRELPLLDADLGPGPVEAATVQELGKLAPVRDAPETVLVGEPDRRKRDRANQAMGDQARLM